MIWCTATKAGILYQQQWNCCLRSTAECIKDRIGHSYNFCFGIDKASWLPARVSCSTHLQVPDSCNVFMNNCMSKSLVRLCFSSKNDRGKECWMVWLLAPDADNIQLWRSLGNYFLKIILRLVIPTVIRHPGTYSTYSWLIFWQEFGRLYNIYSDINSDIYIYIIYIYIYVILHHILDIIPTVTVFGQIFWHVILQISCDIDSDMCSFTLTIALADVMWHIFWNAILHQLWHISEICSDQFHAYSDIFSCSESGSLVSWSPHFLLVKSLTFLQEKHQVSSPNMFHHGEQCSKLISLVKNGFPKFMVIVWLYRTDLHGFTIIIHN